jgi:hypothetical protein
MSAGESVGAPDFPIVDEMAQFAAFPQPTRDYICRALALGREELNQGGVLTGSAWDIACELARRDMYFSLPMVRESLARKGFQLETWTTEFGLLHRYAQFDLQFSEMRDFGAFTFLYERLIGPAVRPWLLSIYLAAAASPKLVEEAREEAIARVTSYDVGNCIVDTPIPIYFPDVVP